MTSAAQEERVREVADLRHIVMALKPLLELGLPLESPGADAALLDLRSNFDWPTDPKKCADEANTLIRRLLAVFPDTNIAPAARILFGESRDRGQSLATRRIAAAKKLRIGEQRFVSDTEPYILSTIAAQIMQLIATPDRRRQDRPPTYLAPRFGFAIAIGLLGLAATQEWLPARNGVITEGHARLIALCLSVATMGLVIIQSLWRRDRDLRLTSVDRDIEPILDPEFLATTQFEAAEHLSHSQIAIPLLVDMILSPSRYRMRIIESISLVGRSIKQEVKLELSFSDVRTFLAPSLASSLLASSASPSSIHASVPTSAANDAESEVAGLPVSPLPPHVSADGQNVRSQPELIYVPVLVPLKGELIDHLQIYRRDGSLAPSLSYTQALRLLSLGLRYLLVAALSGTDGDASVLEQIDFKTAELELLQLISRRGPLDRSPDAQSDTESELDAILRRLSGMANSTASGFDKDRALADVRRYVLKLAYCYPIFVSLPNTTEPRRHLQYERLIVPTPLGTSRLRLWLGLRPDRVQIPITLAFETDSYHLEVVGPVAHYLQEQFVGCRRCRRRLRADWRGVPTSIDGCHHASIGSDERCYIRLRRRVGQNYCHIYMRGFAASHLDDLEMTAEAQFAEAPPGVEERAVLTAFALACVLAIIAYLRSRGSADLPGDVPALLLAVPGVAATWFGFSSDADTVLRSSLTARVSLVATGLMSLAAIAVYYLQHYFGWTAGPSWKFLGIDQWPWLVVIWISLLNLAFIGYKTSARIVQFIWLSGRRRFGWDRAVSIFRRTS